MMNSFLSPFGDYSQTAQFCGIKSDPAGMFDFHLAVDAAADEVRARCGPVLLEEGLTHTVRAASCEVVLHFRAASLTSVTASGVALDVADFYVEPHHLGGHGGQVLRRIDGGLIGPCVIVYTSGWEHGGIPAKLVGAGREVARHLWRTQLGNQRTGDEQGSAWLWPKQAESLAADWFLAPLGFA